MNVDNPSWKCIEHRLLQHAHKSGEHDEVHSRVTQHFHQVLFDLRLQLGAILSRRQISIGNLEGPCNVENTSLENIGYDEPHFRIQITRANPLENRAAITAFARSKNSERKGRHQSC